jgi:hypothetical protein
MSVKSKLSFYAYEFANAASLAAMLCAFALGSGIALAAILFACKFIAAFNS